MRRNMIFTSTITFSLLLNLLMVGPAIHVAAEAAKVPSLTISQLKVTSSNGQFITLYNGTNTVLDMSKYQLEYFNNYDLTKATSSKLIALSGMVPPHGYFMVNDSALLLCYQLTIDSVSLGFSSTAGLVEVLAFNQSNPGAAVAPVLQDYVGWSKTTAAGAQTLPVNTNAFLQRLPVDARNNPIVPTPGTGSWQTVQPDVANACNLITGITGTSVPTGLSQLLPASEPPSTIVNLSTEDNSGPAPISAGSLPASDIGLMAPQVTELLPNPIGTSNDTTNEYIELYNPNGVSFDLSGFVLQSGITSLHNYTFPTGTSLPAHSFKAFYSKDTGLSLSNSGSQVKLLDPLGNSISAAEVYGTAKDGQAWALAKGKWYWTTSLTPGVANIIKQPSLDKKAGSSNAKAKSNKTAASRIKSAKTKKASKTMLANGRPEKPAATQIHPWTLALIAGLALLYGVYEYRADLANRIYQLKRYFRSRRADRV